ncbi:hypothetical protein RM844_11305 [Streptomyces sp. DSM 44915]|uniref:Integral membrane protein n=1 Tax=Streptomyces chisholmiae TaxID=3075540 RepID=A0ABU2JQ60_9ACTN|nr:hypothetical protein [Streptomyces sp. DSM 44915]MDT0266878.1 hypothetical protein [Streptomyces sp. DSM 44915]
MDRQHWQQDAHETAQLPPWPPPLPAPAGGLRHPPGVPPEVGDAVAEKLRGVLSPLRLLGHMTLALALCFSALVFVTASESHATGDSDGALVGLVMGPLLLAPTTVGIVLLTRRAHRASRWLAEQLRAHPAAAPSMAGRRALWGVVSGVGLFFGLVCVGVGVRDATWGSSAPGADGYRAVGVLCWGAVLLVYSVFGLARTFRHRSRHRPPGPPYPGRGAYPGRLPAPGRSPFGMPGPAEPPGPPPDSYEGRRRQLYAEYRSTAEPPAAHRLSPGLRRWIPSLARGPLLSLTALLGLVGCGLAVLTMVLPSRLDDRLVWPLLALLVGYLVLLLMELTHYGSRVWLLVIFGVAGIALAIISWQGYRELALRDRGEWATAEVVSQTTRPRGGTTCGLRLVEADGRLGASLSQKLHGCRSLDLGQRIQVFHDPEDRVSPSRREPTLALPGWLGGGSAAVLLGTALLSANDGHTRRRRLDLLGPPPETARSAQAGRG